MIRDMLSIILMIVFVGALFGIPKYSANYVACRTAGRPLDVCLVGAFAEPVK